MEVDPKIESTSFTRSAKHEILDSSAKQLASWIASREVSSAEVIRCFVDRIQAVNPKLNAVCVERFEMAIAEAMRADDSRADDSRADGRPLHGVPITLKESFQLAGTPATMGLTQLRSRIAAKDGPFTQSLKAAGAIVVAKTNVSTLMFSNETDNPVYGRTVNPWNSERTPGGSTGGEAALIASRGSVLGFGGDLGGSVRVPCHFCGIHGLKPTNRRITRQGSVANIGGLKAFEFQPGPMARYVEDLEIGLRVISRNVASSDAPATHISDYRRIDLSTLKIGVLPNHCVFPVSPAIRRAIHEAANCLENAGAQIESFVAPRFGEAIDLYMGLMSSDGGAGLRSLASGSEIDASITQLFRIGRVPRFVRPAMATTLRWAGQERVARLLQTTGARSAADFWNLTRQRDDYEAEFLKAMDNQELDAIIFPPYALAALKHQTATDLLMAGCYAYVTNLVGLPAGIASLTRVRDDEESDRKVTRDRTDRLAAKSESGSVGLPVGIQVAARHWREDVVLAIMSHLESDFRNRPDYPALPLGL